MVQTTENFRHRFFREEEEEEEANGIAVFLRS